MSLGERGEGGGGGVSQNAWSRLQQGYAQETGMSQDAETLPGPYQSRVIDSSRLTSLRKSTGQQCDEEQRCLCEAEANMLYRALNTGL